MSSNALPYLTSSDISIHGTIKTIPEDFVVEEIPAYLPSGEGEHLYLWLQKKDISADYLVGHVARTLGIQRDEIGVAGLKDRRAVTRQWISVPARACEEKVETLNTDLIQVLDSKRHGNKLRSGHLRGNRFEILVRDTHAGDFERAGELAQQIRELGVPNYFGEQRFGHDGETLQLGLSLLKGEKVARMPPQKRKFLTRLALSAVQSDLFNQVLARRLRDSWLQTVTLGDLMQVRATGGIFEVEDAAIEQARFDQSETVMTGPLFGPKMKAPTGRQLELETTVLAESGLVSSDFERNSKLTSGARRPLLIWPEDLQVTQATEGVLLSFSLPSGCYATVLLSEFLKDN